MRAKTTEAEALDQAELPEGWGATRLGDGLVVGVQPGFACGVHNREGQGVPHLRPMNVSEEGQISLRDLKYVARAEVQREEQWLRAGEVLFNNTNSPELVGKTAYYDLPEPRAFSNHMTRIRCRAEVLDARFCAHVLHHKWREGYFVSVCNNHVSQASVSRGVLLETSIPLPPLAEQHRIVAQIEALLARVNAARERLAKVPATLKRFRQSVLAAACSGRLTEEWRDRHPSTLSRERIISRKEQLFEVPDGWKWAGFSELITRIRSGSTVPPQNEQTDYPILRSSSVRPGTVDLADVRFLSAKESRNANNYLAEGDLLFTRLSGSLEYVANCAVVRGLGDRRIQFPDRLFCAKLTKPSQGPFVELCFNNPRLRSALTDEAKSSAGHQRVSTGSITRYEIPLPPSDEQHEIVRRVDALFKLADAMDRRVKAGTARAEKLTQAILAKAFRGELVPTEAELAHREGRDYEPATVLLERIRAERAEPSPRPFPRGRGRRRAQMVRRLAAS